MSPAPAAMRAAPSPAPSRAVPAALRARAVLALAILLAGTFVFGIGGCARRSDERAGATAEREEIRGGRRILLKSRVSPRRATLGDPVAWTLSAELPAAAVPGKLLRSDAGPELDIKAPSAPQSERARATASGGGADRIVWAWPYLVRGFGLGAIALPAVRLPVVYGAARDTLIFPADTLAVDSLTRAATGTVLPDRGPITPELRPIDYAVMAGLLLLAIIAVLLIVRAIRRRRQRGLEPAVPAEPADVLLRREIATLRAEGEPLPRDAFYDRLSLAIRDYAAAATDITTRDRTTMEIVRDLRARPAIAPDGVDALRRALTRADLAKFARRGGGWDEALEVLEVAERLPDRLPVRAPAPEPGAATPPASPTPSARTEPTPPPARAGRG